MCIVKYSACPGCYGLHDNQIIEIERCMRQIYVKWGLPFPKDGRVRKKDDGPCPRALHVQHSLYETEQYATHEHTPGLVGRLELRRHATLKFTGKMSDLEIVPTEQPVEAPPEEEETTKKEWTRTLTNLAGYSEENGSLDIGFSGPPLELFTERPHKCNGQQPDENGVIDASSRSTPKRTEVTEWAGETWYFPCPILYDPTPPRRTVAKDSVEVAEVVKVVANNPSEKIKPTHIRRGGKQQPSPPASPPRAAQKPKTKSIPVETTVQKKSQRPKIREKKEARRRGRPLGVKNCVRGSRSGGRGRRV